MTRRFAIFIAFRFHNSPLFACQSVQYDKKRPNHAVGALCRILFYFLRRLSLLADKRVPADWKICTRMMSRMTAANITRYL